MASIAYGSNLPLLRQKHSGGVGLIPVFAAQRLLVVPKSSVAFDNKSRSFSQTRRSGFRGTRAATEVVDDRIVENEDSVKEKGRVLRVGLVCGGPSAERGISLNSARSVLDHIQVLLLLVINTTYILRGSTRHEPNF